MRRRPMETVVIRAALAVAVLAASATAPAQSFPTKPIRLVVGSEPSSAPDVYARVVAGPMSRILGQPVLVENRPARTATSLPPPW